MTHEEAARILDPETSREALAGIGYYGGFRGEDAVLEAANDACRIAAEVLRSDLLARAEAAEAENAALRKMQPIQLDDTGAQALTLAAEVSELNQKLDEAEARCETLEKMVKEYQEIIVPGYRERAEKAEMCIDAIEDDLDRGNDNDWAREHIAEWRGQKEE